MSGDIKLFLESFNPSDDVKEKRVNARLDNNSDDKHCSLKGTGIHDDDEDNSSRRTSLGEDISNSTSDDGNDGNGGDANDELCGRRSKRNNRNSIYEKKKTNNGKSNDRLIHRIQKYRKAWENDETFASWIGPTKESEMKAHCRLCNTTMLSEITVLKKHALSEKHIRRLMSMKVGSKKTAASTLDKYVIKKHRNNEKTKLSARLSILGDSMKKIVDRTQSYKKEWENDETFASWICPSNESKLKAMCRLCNKTLLADVVVLKRHAFSQNHIEIMKGVDIQEEKSFVVSSGESFEDQTITNETNENNQNPADVKISTIKSEFEENDETGDISEELNSSKAVSLESCDDVDSDAETQVIIEITDEYKIPKYSPTKKRKKLSHRLQNYRTEWEKDERFSSWIGPSKKSKARAICKICDSTMLSEISVLKRHAMSYKHAEMVDLVMQQPVADCIESFDDHGNISVKNESNRIEAKQNLSEITRGEGKMRKSNEMNEEYTSVAISQDNLLNPDYDGETFVKVELTEDLDFSECSSQESTKKPIQRERVQKYCKEWENDEMFTRWIGPSDESERKAVCRLCNITMLAEIGILKRHASSQKHINLLKESSIDSKNNFVVGNLEKFCYPVIDDKTDEDEEIEVEFPSQRNRIKQVHRAQNYRRQWEKNEMFANWIAPSNQSKKRAICRLCKKTLLAEVMVLKRHAVTQRHKRAEAAFKNKRVTQSFNELSDANEACGNNEVTLQLFNKSPLTSKEPNVVTEELNTSSIVKQEVTVDSNDVDKTQEIDQMAEDLDRPVFIITLENFDNTSKAAETLEFDKIVEYDKIVSDLESKSSKKHRNPNYCKEWEEDELFANWIAPVMYCKTKAYCKLCNSLILADYSVLKRHAAGLKHMKMVNDMSTDSRNPCNQEKSADTKDEDKTSENDVDSIISAPLSQKTEEKSGKELVHRVQRYCKEWEEDELYADWIAPDNECETKAVCRLCVTIISAEKQSLKKHALTQKHVEIAKSLGIYKEISLKTEACSLEASVTPIKKAKRDYKPPKYRKEWEDNALLADWVGPSMESERNAVCRLCQTTMLADLTVLKRHPSSRKHVDNLKNGSAITYNMESYNEMIEDFNSTPLHKVLCYRQKWEEDPGFAGWISPSTESKSKAVCRACNKTMIAEITVLKRHSLTTKHLKNIARPDFKEISVACSNLEFPDTNDAEEVFVESLDPVEAHKNNVNIAEFNLAKFLSENKIPLKAADHLVEVIKACFPDSEIAKSIKFCNLIPYCFDNDSL